MIFNKQTFKISLIFTTLFIIASCGKVSFKEANNRYSLKQYAVAADMYKKVYKSKNSTKKEKLQSAIMTAESYYYAHDYKSSEKWYASAIRAGAKDPIYKYRLAESMKMNGKWTEAMAKFQEYKKENPDDLNTDVMILGCEQALKWKNEKTRYHIDEFKPANSKDADDFSPMWANKKRTQIYFTSDRAEGYSKKQYQWYARGYSDLWSIDSKGKKNEVNWDIKTLALVPGANTEWNDGTCTFDEKFQKMYFTQCNGLKGDEKRCKIYEARKTGKEWDIQPKPLSFCENVDANFGHPTLSPNGEKLFFTSDMFGGMGDTGSHDIYVVTYSKRGKTWSDPINLGSNINTSANEMFPYAFDDTTLYFSSDGHPGLGGLDIFYSIGTGVDWSKPVNMKSPINSYADDFGIIMNETKEKGYFSSNRSDNGKQDDNIYQFYMDPLIFTLSGVVTDCKDGKKLSKALILISNNNDSSKIRVYTDETGYYKVNLKVNTKYEYYASKSSDNYFDSKTALTSTIGLEQSKDFKQDFCLRNQCNEVYVLPIYYGLDSANIRGESRKILDDLVAVLKKYPNMALEVGSHTDCRSSYDYNKALSQRRADSAVSYILKSGVNPFRLEAKGYGESVLKNECACEDGKAVPCSEEKHQENRRTEAKVTNCNFTWNDELIKKFNTEALPEGAIISPFLQDEKKKYLANPKNLPTKPLVPNSPEAKKAEADALKEKYDIVPITRSRDIVNVSGKIGKKSVKFVFDPEESSIIIPEVTVVSLLTSKIITPESFIAGGSAYKLPDGTKVKSKSFEVKELTIGDIKFENVRCVIGGADIKKPILGTSLFEMYNGVTIEGDNMLLEKKK